MFSLIADLAILFCKREPLGNENLVCSNFIKYL
jgi:hypothetical protein